jgi:hypothetical protein
MTETIFNANCAGECVFADPDRELRISSSDPSGSGGVSLDPEGNLSYVASSRCGVRAGHVGAKLMAQHAPDLFNRIAECEGPVTRETEVPRLVLGLLGMKKTITVTECGATSTQELLDIAFADSLME